MQSRDGIDVNADCPRFRGIAEFHEGLVVGRIQLVVILTDAQDEFLPVIVEGCLDGFPYASRAVIDCSSLGWRLFQDEFFRHSLLRLYR